MKRKTFPRFYFVSDLVLLKFLSQGSDPEAVQEDFDKLFDAISKVTFEKQDKKSTNKMITEIKNSMGNDDEVLPLQAPVVCADFIEKWLQNLERVMQISVNEVIKKAVLEIFNLQMKDGSLQVDSFVNQYPA